jgi:hypothetical protein
MHDYDSRAEGFHLSAILAWTKKLRLQQERGNTTQLASTSAKVETPLGEGWWRSRIDST